jgi:outer membrane protein OmpA-like peptidoglycan-associated protein
MKRCYLFIGSSILFFLFIFSGSIAQDVIELRNPSFEGFPSPGTSERIGITAIGWTDCGGYWFPNETPPDIHPGPSFNPWFGVTTKAQEGETFLGMVVRDNDSWESVSQPLLGTLEAGKCYSFSIYLAKSLTHVSNTVDMESQTESCVLRIHGGSGICDKREVLGETSPVSHEGWKRYDFTFQPRKDYSHLILEAFYKTPVLFPYKGNILVDNASDILQIPCPGEEVVADLEEPTEEVEEVEPDPVPAPEKEDIRVEVKKEKILKDLDATKVAKGQKIRIQNLYFPADKTEVMEDSYEVLDEIVGFLKENQNIRVEIGGHTNGTPEHEYCDSLSDLRAKSVASYLVHKGVNPGQLEHRGYGKRKPVASNTTRDGRKKNQRVEIKILSIEG